MIFKSFVSYNDFEYDLHDQKARCHLYISYPINILICQRWRGGRAGAVEAEGVLYLFHVSKRGLGYIPRVMKTHNLEKHLDRSKWKRCAIGKIWRDLLFGLTEFPNAYAENWVIPIGSLSANGPVFSKYENSTDQTSADYGISWTHHGILHGIRF